MKKIKRYAPLVVRKTLYQSLINQRLTYGIKCWGFACDQLTTIQKKAVRIMANSKTKAHTSPIFKLHKILTVQDIFKLNCLKMHHRIEMNLAHLISHRLLSETGLSTTTQREHEKYESYILIFKPSKTA